MSLKRTRFGDRLLRRIAIAVASFAVFLLYVLPVWACRQILRLDRLHLRLDRRLSSYWERDAR
jgi:hypothetical protein